MQRERTIYAHSTEAPNKCTNGSLAARWLVGRSVAAFENGILIVVVVGFFCRLSSDTETYFSRNVIWSTFFPSFLALRLRLMVLGNRHGQTVGRRSFGRCWLLLSFGARQSACKWSKPHRQRRPYRLLCTSRTLELVVAMLDGWQDKCGVCRCYA